MFKVSIIQQEVPHYRLPFFTAVQSFAARSDLDVTVYSAKAPDPPAGAFQYRVMPIWSFPGGSGYWIRALAGAVNGSAAVVAPHELRCVTVPYLWAIRRRICRRWIWWGHGWNHQRRGTSDLADLVKQAMTRRGDALITYTPGGAAYWRDRGLPAHRVIPFFNTVDVDGLRRAAESIPEGDVRWVKTELGLEDRSVLLFSGRLYREKRVDFLLRAFALLQERGVPVALLVLGDGPERTPLEALSARLGLRDVHFLGACVEPSEAGVYFRLADLLVIPGLVGLAIVHGFAFGLPLVTTSQACHSPEIEYLAPENGVMTHPDETAYAGAIERLVSAPEVLAAMRRSAAAAADGLRMEHSAERFVHAIRSVVETGGP